MDRHSSGGETEQLARPLRVLLVIDTRDWILARIATAIAAENDWIEPTIISAGVLSRLLRRAPNALGEIDLVHFVIPNGGELIDRFSGKVPLVTSMHHFDDSQPISAIEKGDIVVVTATQWREWWLERGRQPSRLFLLPNGVDSTVFAPRSDEQRARLRISLGIASDERVIGFAGKPATVESRKGTDVFLSALKKLASMDHRVVALLIGPGWEAFSDSLRREGVRVITTGFLSSHAALSELYACMDLFLITARVEGGPCTLLEAMGAARCVISSPVGMALDIIESGQNGFIVPNGDFDAFADTALSLLNDAEQRIKIGLSARQAIEAAYDWNSTSKGAAELYASAITQFAGTYVAPDYLRSRSSRKALLHSERRYLHAIAAEWREWVDAQERANWMRILQNVGEGKLARSIAWSLVSSRPLDLDVYREIQHVVPDHVLAKPVSFIVRMLRRILLFLRRG